MPTDPLHEPDRVGTRTDLANIAGTEDVAATDRLQPLRTGSRQPPWTTRRHHHVVVHTRPARRRPLPRVPVLARPFGEEHLRPAPEFVRRGGMPVPGPAPGAPCAGRSAVP
ncbi:hypothetical protein IOD14_36865 [Streptomyces sp. A2-16]|nr:hypothetical protein [Streptomyces sp. A2-16]QUC61903.1 hypothetical protein IOD14_36865 [Streptomyces sp. A2-16]